MFQCDKCGLCCMKVGQSSIYEKLDRGDGICRYFDDVSRLCSIYNNRPVVCNIDKAYDVYFREKMSREEFYKLNYKACEKLKKDISMKCK